MAMFGRGTVISIHRKNMEYNAERAAAEERSFPAIMSKTDEGIVVRHKHLRFDTSSDKKVGRGAMRVACTNVTSVGNKWTGLQFSPCL